jgi:hypothetical protein
MTTDTKTREMAGALASKRFTGALGALQGAAAGLEEEYVKILERLALEEPKPGAWRRYVRRGMAMLITRRIGGLGGLGDPVDPDELTAFEEELSTLMQADNVADARRETKSP